MTTASFLARLFFHASGRPRGLVRKILFHSNRKPRRAFRILVLHSNGRPRRLFRQWLSGAPFGLRLTPRARRIYRELKSAIAKGRNTF